MIITKASSIDKAIIISKKDHERYGESIFLKHIENLFRPKVEKEVDDTNRWVRDGDFFVLSCYKVDDIIRYFIEDRDGDKHDIYFIIE